MKKLLIALTTGLMAATTFADPAGVYDITMETRRGMQTLELVIRAEGDGYVGELNGGRAGDREIASIIVDGDSFEFPMQIETPMGDMTLTYKGSVSGDEIMGNIETPMGARPFSGSRQ